MDNTLRNGYHRNCFDRFGDDLCELLLQYMSLDMKIRFECVSRQWKRSVYSRQYALHIQTLNTIKAHVNGMRMCDALPNNQLLSFYPNNHQLERVSIIQLVLKKCSSINRIIIGENIIKTIETNDKYLTYDQLIRLIADNCCGLTSIEFCDQRFATISDNALKYFSEKCGKSLKTIVNESYGFRFNSLLSSCRNLSTISNVYLNDLIDDKSNEILAPNLTEVKALNDCEGNCDLMDQFVSRYPMIKVLNIRYNSKDSAKFISALTQLVYLTNLSIITSGIEISQFACNLAKLALKCRKIKSLSINLCQCSDNYNYYLLLNAINNFGELKSLVLSIPEAGIIENENERLSVKLMRNCVNLTHLSVRASISNKFFTDIQLYLPRLKIINIETLRRISDKAMDYFSNLTQLKAIKVVITMKKNAKITDIGICNVLEKCSHFNTLTLRPALRITDKTINAFNTKATINQKMNFNLNLYRCDANVRETIRCALNSKSLCPNFKIPIQYFI